VLESASFPFSLLQSPTTEEVKVRKKGRVQNAKKIPSKVQSLVTICIRVSGLLDFG
jgi:hypothetical protein